MSASVASEPETNEDVTPVNPLPVLFTTSRRSFIAPSTNIEVMVPDVVPSKVNEVSAAPGKSIRPQSGLGCA